MKKIINGKLYNTETAKTVISWKLHNRGDFQYASNTLYVTKKGNYFVAGCGGPLSEWSVSHGNGSYSSGEGLRDISEKTARELVAQYGTPEDYEKWFTVEEA